MTTEMVVIIGLSIVILILLALLSEAKRKAKNYLVAKENEKSTFDDFMESQEKLRIANNDVKIHLASIKDRDETIIRLDDRITELRQQVEKLKREASTVPEEKMMSENPKKPHKKSTTKKSL